MPTTLPPTKKIMKMLLWHLLPLLFLLLLVVGVLIFTAAFTLVERKLMGLHQRREGPDRVGFEGLGQPFADGLKLLRKETLLPKDSPERRVFFLAPLLSLWVSLLLWTLVPLSPAGPFVSEELGLLLVLGLSSLGSYGVIYAGWASNNKYALLGAFRAVAQFISYEIVFSLLFLPLIGITGSANLQSIVDYQAQEGWFSYLVPLWGLSFLVILAETNRTPFDLPEAEAELVAGFNVEYSSLLFAFFFLAEYSAMGFFGALLVTLFFGGYTLVPLGWGWDNDRPLDTLSAIHRAYDHSFMSRRLADLICVDYNCFRPKALPEWQGRRSWPVNKRELAGLREGGRDTRLQLLGELQHELQATLHRVDSTLPPLSSVQAPWVSLATKHQGAPTAVDQLFQNIFSVYSSGLRRAPRLLDLQCILDVALFNPVDPRDAVLWAALLPGLFAVPVLALKVQLVCVAFIVVRASLPRLRFDQLTLLC
jgi:NADH:ubiquinone oxidoreductase subunit H